MHIVGGLYREQCCIPEWNALFGSGGRAAAAIASFSPGSTLHTYVEDFSSEEISAIKKLGVEMRLNPRHSAIVFSYFHPLSKPYVLPEPSKIQPQESINVSESAVLRFGFLEGDAVVDGNRVVYDPQTWRNPESFSSNGSNANKLAIVLNEIEIQSLSGLSDLSLAASKLIESENATVVVVKRGSRGAKIFEQGGQTISIPAYRSSRVFKIGTGDVFSAIFAHYWAEKKSPVSEAADIASRSVAAYCSTGELPLKDNKLYHLKPIKYVDSGSVLLLGAVNTIGQRYTMEEARFVLEELGIKVSCPSLDGDRNSKTKAALIIAEGLSKKAVSQINLEITGMPIVVLQQKKVKALDELIKERHAKVIDDFTSAIYFSAWAAEESTISTSP